MLFTDIYMAQIETRIINCIIQNMDNIFFLTHIDALIYALVIAKCLYKSLLKHFEPALHECCSIISSYCTYKIFLDIYYIIITH